MLTKSKTIHLGWEWMGHPGGPHVVDCSVQWSFCHYSCDLEFFRAIHFSHQMYLRIHINERISKCIISVPSSICQSLDKCNPQLLTKDLLDTFFLTK